MSNKKKIYSGRSNRWVGGLRWWYYSQYTKNINFSPRRSVWKCENSPLGVVGWIFRIFYVVVVVKLTSHHHLRVWICATDSSLSYIHSGHTRSHSFGFFTRQKRRVSESEGRKIEKTILFFILKFSTHAFGLFFISQNKLNSRMMWKKRRRIHKIMPIISSFICWLIVKWWKWMWRQETLKNFQFSSNSVSILRAREQIFAEKRNKNEEILLLENQYTSQDCSLLSFWVWWWFFFPFFFMSFCLSLLSWSTV